MDEKRIKELHITQNNKPRADNLVEQAADAGLKAAKKVLEDNNALGDNTKLFIVVHEADLEEPNQVNCVAGEHLGSNDDLLTMLVIHAKIVAAGLGLNLGVQISKRIDKSKVTKWSKSDDVT